MGVLDGKSLAHYQILSQVDEGGMATIYKAVDTHLERHVAIKIIRKESFSADLFAQVLKRFEREAKSLAQLSHPNIVKVIDYGEYEGAPYLVLEFLSGGTLKNRLQGKVSEGEAVRWLIPISHALAYAHRRGVIHRDVKPSNILFTETNEPMLTDFGIAKILESDSKDSLTGSGVGIGTPEYMAPEQGLGQAVDARTDIYALGIVLFEILTGRRPFQADTPMSIVLKHVNEPLPDPRQFNPAIPELARQILNKALAKNPQDRYPDMAAFSNALTQLAAQYLVAPGSAEPLHVTGAEAPGAARQADRPIEGTQPIREEDTGKLLLRISRLEKVAEESLAAEDFDDAENLITTIEGLGERGRLAAARLRTSLELSRKKARQRDADISNIRLALPRALEAEEITKAEDMLRQLQSLGPKGVALADQFKVAVETARQQIAQRQAEINRLSSLAEKSIQEENFSQAEAFLLSLSLVGGQGKAQAARLREALERSQQEVSQRKAEVYRLAGLVEQQIAGNHFDDARQTLHQLAGMGADGKAAVARLGEIIKKAEATMLAQALPPSPLPVVEQTQTSAPLSRSAAEGAPPLAEKPLSPAAGKPARSAVSGLRWIIFGAVLLVVGIMAGVGIAVRLVSTPSPTPALGQAGETPAVTLPLAAGGEASREPTQPLPTGTLTATPTRTPLPTETPVPPASLTPTLSPTPQSYKLTVDADYANIRTGPGTVYLIVASKTRGTLLEAVGRNEAGDWLVVALENGKVGWISTKVAAYAFEVDLLPVVQAPPTPIPPTKKPADSKSDGSSGSDQPTWTPPPP